MKAALVFIGMLLLAGTLQAQTLLYSEDFEANTLPDSVVYTGTGTSGKSSALYSQGVRSDSMQIATAGDSMVMTTQAFSTIGNSFVMLYFNHICKIEFSDEAFIEVSNDNGATWTRLSGLHYQGTGQFVSQGNKFSASSYEGWASGLLSTPSNTWWKNEIFDISLLAGNFSNVMIRFIVRDLSSGSTMPDNYAWFIDNVRVQGALSDFHPPLISLVYPVPEDTLYTSTPYLIKAKITDFSGIDTAYVAYTVNTGVTDTIGMTKIAPDTFQCSIPFYGFGRTFFYKLCAVDSSASHNLTIDPASGTRMFYSKYSPGGTVSIGNGLNSSPDVGPIYANSSNSTHLYSNHISLFTAAEIGLAGALSTISWFKTNAQSYILNNGTFRIYLKHTNDTTINSLSGTFAAELAGATLAYESFTQNLPPNAGWMDFLLNNPNGFVYNGVQNLMVLVDWYRPGTITQSIPWMFSIVDGMAYTWRDYKTPPSISIGHDCRPDIKLTFVTPSSLLHDAGISQIVTPNGGVMAGAPFNISARVKNYGTALLTNATVKWSLDGIQQLSHVWTGSLLQNGVSADLLLGSLTLPVGVHTLKIWTDSPNGQSDMNLGNDTSVISFMVCSNPLSGIYTIGGVNHDFADFSAALTAMDHCGISGPVTFKVAPGIYTEQVTIPFISGASASSPVVFQSANGDSTSVVLQYNAPFSLENFTLKFKNASYVTFSKMSIKALNAVNGRTVEIAGTSSNLKLENNILQGVENPAKSADAARAVVYSTGFANDSCLFLNNLVVDGEHGFFLRGQSSAHEKGTQLSGNRFKGQIINGIAIFDQNAPLIQGNTIYITNLVDTFRAIYIHNSDGVIRVTENQIVIGNAIRAIGIELAECISDSIFKGLIANNMVSVKINLGTANSLFSAGIFSNNCSNQRFVFNSVNLWGSSIIANSAFRMRNITNNQGNLILSNNLVNQVSNGAVLCFDGIPLQSFISNYNNLFAINGIIVHYVSPYLQLDLWQSSSNHDLNSFCNNPNFISNTDLHISNSILKRRGFPIADVTTDFDGNMRHPLYPDPGADEFDSSAIDVALLGIISPSGGCGMGANESVTLLIRNTGSTTVTSGLTAHFRFDNSAGFISESISTPLNAGDTLMYTFNAKVNMKIYSPLLADTFPLQAWISLAGDMGPSNDSVSTILSSYYTPLSPMATGVSVPYATKAVLSATGNPDVVWYAHDTSSVKLTQGTNLTTPFLFTNTTFWAATSTGALMQSGSYIPGANIASQAVVSASTCYSGACGTLNDLNFGACGEQQVWISTAMPPVPTPHVNFIDFEWATEKTIDGIKIHHGYENDRFLTGATLYKWINGNWINFHTFSFLPMGCESVVSFPFVKTTKLRITSFQMTGPGQTANPNFREIEVFEAIPPGCESERVPVLVTVGSPPAIDAGVDQIISPTGSGGYPQNIPVIVRLKNYGTNFLYSVNLYYSLNSVLKDSVSWTGLLLKDSSIQVTIDTISLSGGDYCFKAWTAKPNGITDIIASNDSATLSFKSCMAGTYSIGPAATGTYQFNTFNSALNALLSAGICGPVIFEVYPGTYTEQLNIPQIAGMNALNTVTFRGISGDSTQAVLQFAGLSTANWTIRLNGADYFTFEKLSIKALSQYYGRAVEIKNIATYNIFKNCLITSAGTSSTTSSCIYDYTTLNHYNSYLNNYFYGGYYGLYISGSAAYVLQKGTVIEGNSVAGYYNCGIFVVYADSAQIIGNRVFNNVFLSGNGIRTEYINNAFRIVGNYVHITSSGSTPCNGIFMYGGNNTSFNPTRVGLVANNMVIIYGGTGANNGFYTSSSHGTEVCYNTFRILGGSTSSTALKQVNSNSELPGQVFQNNILVNMTGGYAAYFSSPANVLGCDYNLYYTATPNLAYWGSNTTTLAALQIASGTNSNSINIQPSFVSSTDVHLTNNNLAGKGKFLASIATDFDNDLRGLKPTMGADEKPYIGIDAGVFAITSPDLETFEYQSSSVAVAVANYGSDTLYSIPIQYMVNNGIPVNTTVTDTLISNSIKSYTLPNMLSPAGNFTLCATTLVSGDIDTANNQVCKTVFGIPAKDAKVSKLVVPANGCNLGLQPLSVWVKNTGLNPMNYPSQSAVTIHYRIKPAAPVISQIFTPILMPGDSILVHFNTQADFSVTLLDDTFKVQAWINLQDDNIKGNDTAYAEVMSFAIPPAPMVTNVTIPFGTSIQLAATSSDTLLWFESDTSVTNIGHGPFFTTPALQATETYWVQAVNASDGGGDLPEMFYYNFDVPGTQVYNLAKNPMGNNPATITGPGLSIGGAGMFNSALQGSGVNSTGGVINTGWNTNFNGSFTIAFWLGNVTNTTNNCYVFGDIGASYFKCFSNGTAGANNLFVGGGGLPDLIITDAATVTPKMIHVVLDTAEGTFKGYVDGVLNVVAPVTAPIAMAGTGFQIGGYGTATNLSGSLDEFRIYNRALTQTEILSTCNTSLGYAGCGSVRVPVTVTVINPSTCDVGVSQLLQPITGTNLSAQETVIVKVKNYGTLSQSNIPVCYQIDSQPVVTETVSGPISPNDSMVYAFNAKANLGTAGTYQVKTWTSLPCDTLKQNDTLLQSIAHLIPAFCVSSATSPLNQEITNITLSNLNNTSAPSGAMYTNFISTVPAAILSPGVNYSMTITSSFAPGSSSSQSCWAKAWIDFDRNGVFDPVNEMVLSNATSSSNTITAQFTLPSNAIIGNTYMRIVLNQTTNATLVTPCSTYTYGETEDYAISITPQAQCDAGAIAIMQPEGITYAGASLPVWVKYTNLGTQPIAANTLSVAYKVNNGTPVTVSITSGLAPGATDSILMPPFIANSGYNAICAYTILVCDSTPFNDQVCKSVFAQLYSTLPYFDDFEGPNYFYNPDPASDWMLGTPAANIINSAYSGTKVWATNLTGDYSNNANDYIYTPLFDFTGLGATDTVTLSFHHWLAMASGDYSQVQYKLNGSSGWVNLGASGDPGGINWYNTQVGGVHYFSQTNSGWMYSAYKLLPAIFNWNDTVQFRFRLFSTASGTSNGWAIDNFSLALPTVPDDVGISAITYPINDTASGSQINVEVVIKNFGTSTQVMIPLQLKMDGVTMGTETWTGFLASQATAVYTFVMPITSPSITYQLCVSTQLPGDVFASNDEFCKSFNALPANHDVGIVQIVDPIPDSIGEICFYDPVTHPWYMKDVIVRIQNFGQNAQTSIPIRYTFFNGGTAITDTWTGNLASNANVDYLLQTQFAPTIGAQLLCAETDLPGDFSTTNNKACQSYIGRTCIGVDDLVADGMVLMQNIPNPAGTITSIGFSLPKGGKVTFGVVNTIGQTMVLIHENKPAGSHSFEIDISKIPAGVYSYYIQFNGRKLSRRMIIYRP